jgi:hypothetical protein
MYVNCHFNWSFTMLYRPLVSAQYIQKKNFKFKLIFNILTENKKRKKFTGQESEFFFVFEAKQRLQIINLHCKISLQCCGRKKEIYLHLIYNADMTDSKESLNSHLKEKFIFSSHFFKPFHIFVQNT